VVEIDSSVDPVTNEVFHTARLVNGSHVTHVQLNDTLTVVSFDRDVSTCAWQATSRGGASVESVRLSNFANTPDDTTLWVSSDMAGNHVLQAFSLTVTC
jgi:hypothetical protein